MINTKTIPIAIPITIPIATPNPSDELDKVFSMILSSGIVS